MVISRAECRRSLDKAVEALEKMAPAKELEGNYQLWKRYPVIDAVYLVRSCHRNVLETIQLPERLKDLRFDRALPPGVRPSGEFALSEEYIDPDTNTFRYCKQKPPTLQAVDVGLRLARETLVAEGQERLDNWLPTVKKTAKWLQEALADERHHDGKGGCSAVGNGEATVFGTYSAVSCLATYKRLAEVVEDLPGVEFPFENALEDLQSQGKDVKPLSTTSYASAIAELIRDHELGDSHTIEVARALETSQTANRLKLLEETWDPQSGGFRPLPGPSHMPNLGHTRYAMQLLRAMLRNPDSRLTGIPAWLDFDKVLSFVNSCWVVKGPYTGFANTQEENDIPSVCAERSASNIVKLVEILERSSYGKPVARDSSGRVPLFDKLADSRRRLQEFYVDEVARVCYAYPVGMIIGAEPLSSRLRWGIRAGLNIYGRALTHPTTSGYIDRRTGRFTPLDG